MNGAWAVTAQTQNVSAAPGWELSHHFINQHPAIAFAPRADSLMWNNAVLEASASLGYLRGRPTSQIHFTHCNACAFKLSLSLWNTLPQHLYRPKTPLFLSRDTTAFSRCWRRPVPQHLCFGEACRYVCPHGIPRAKGSQNLSIKACFRWSLEYKTTVVLRHLHFS